MRAPVFSAVAVSDQGVARNSIFIQSADLYLDSDPRWAASPQVAHDICTGAGVVLFASV